MREEGNTRLRLIPGGKGQETDPLEKLFKKIIASKWFLVIVIIYTGIAWIGFPITLYLLYCHHIGK
jgi:hypothetical protein